MAMLEACDSTCLSSVSDTCIAHVACIIVVISDHFADYVITDLIILHINYMYNTTLYAID